MLRSLTSLVFVGVAWAGSSGLLQSRQISSVYPPPSDSATDASCASLQNSCNATTVDLTNFYSYVPCIMLTVCSQDFANPAQVLEISGAPASQPRLTEATFNTMSGGNSNMSQQNYLDAYYNAISQTPDGTYPDNNTFVAAQWQAVVAWAGFCDTSSIPYSNFADWLEYSSMPGVCPAVASCDPSLAATVKPCVPQPGTDNGSCAEVASECEFFVGNGLFQNEYCVLASLCYAWSNTDVLLQNLYPLNSTPPTTSQQARLSEDVFNTLADGAPTMSQQNAIDAYYTALTGTWKLDNGSCGSTPVRTTDNGPYPTSNQYVVDFWGVVSAWTSNCETGEISYSNLADYLSYAAGSNYHPSC